MIHKFTGAFFVLLFLSAGLYAQNEEAREWRPSHNFGQELNITGMKDDPRNFYNFGFTYGLNSGSMPESPQYGILLNLGFDYNVRNTRAFYFKTNLQMANEFLTKYGNIKGLDNRMSTNSFKPYNVFETGLSFNILSKRIEKYKTLKIKQQQRPHKAKDVYKTEFQGTVKRMLKGRAGFHNYNITVTNWNLKPTTLKSADGTEIYTLDRNNVNSIDQPSVEVYHTNMTVNTLFFGVSYHSLNDTKLERASESSIFNSSHFEVFADFMMAPSITFADMEVAGQTYDVGHDNGGGFEARNTGFRLGLNYDNKVSEHSGVTYGFEIGQRPGWKNIETQNWITNSTYFMLTISAKLGLSQDLL